MAEFVRRKRRHTGRRARPPDRRPQPVGGHALERAPLGDTVVPRTELKHRLEDELGHLDPPGTPRLGRRCGDTPTFIRLVYVAPRETLELANAHSGRVENE